MVDVNGNGICNADTDVLDKNDVQVTTGFMIPEFLSFMLLPLFMIATLLAVIISKRKQRAPRTVETIKM